MKKIYYPIIIIAAIAAVIVAEYFLRQKPPADISSEQSGKLPVAGNISSNPPIGAQTAQQTTTANGEPSVSASGRKFGVVAENPVLNFFVDGENNAILVQPDGQIVKVVGGAATVLSSSVITDLLKADFSYDGKKILVAFGDRFNQQFSIFDIAGKSWQPLSISTNSAVWSPNNYQIAYFITEKSGVKALTTFDISKSNAKPISVAKIHAEDMFSIWVSQNQILISDKESALYPGSLWSLNPVTKTITSFAGETLGLETIWDGASGMGLVFGTSNIRRGGNLSLFDTSGKNIQRMSFLTLPSKCSFATETKPAATSSIPIIGANAISAKIKTAAIPPPPIQQKFLYCAVPRDSEEFGSSQLPDDYLKRKLFTSDDFYKINLQDGSISAIFADPAANLDASNPKIFNQTLLFINRLDKRLYAISLK